jgi:hypothetical protein
MMLGQVSCCKLIFVSYRAFSVFGLVLVVLHVAEARGHVFMRFNVTRLPTRSGCRYRYDRYKPE